MATDTVLAIDHEAPANRAGETAAARMVERDLHRTIIRPVRGWRWFNARELWEYRELLFFLAWRDVKVRYKQTVLGAAWAILQPAMMMVVFSVFFGRMAHVETGGLPYPLFVFCGLLPWTFFATAIANAGNSVVGSERVITKIYFPRLAIPFASVGAALVDFAVACGMLMALMLWYRVAPTWGLLWVLPLVLLFTLAALGVGTLLAALNVAYRDFRYVIPFLVQLWMFATPTVYMQPVEKASGARGQATGATNDSSASPGRNALGEVPTVDAQSGVEASERDDKCKMQNAKCKMQNDASGGGLDFGHPSPKAQDLRPKTSDSNSKAERGGASDYLQQVLNLNPLTGLVAAFRAAVVGGPMPWSMLGWSTGGVLLSFLIGCLYFRKVEDSFADII